MAGEERPVIAEPIVKAVFVGRGVCGEIGSDVANMEAHGKFPLYWLQWLILMQHATMRK